MDWSQETNISHRSVSFQNLFPVESSCHATRWALGSPTTFLFSVSTTSFSSRVSRQPGAYSLLCMARVCHERLWGCRLPAMWPHFLPQGSSPALNELPSFWSSEWGPLSWPEGEWSPRNPLCTIFLGCLYLQCDSTVFKSHRISFQDSSLEIWMLIWDFALGIILGLFVVEV
jgi:hypothetical protein